MLNAKPTTNSFVLAGRSKLGSLKLQPLTHAPTSGIHAAFWVVNVRQQTKPASVENPANKQNATKCKAYTICRLLDQ
ncbi:uncharacterized protein TRIVIDRAFT_213946 [Trichoderma virens Gv29-8]|uniref:Uncharacterized protein n=1 Tax=Hypocrea virens (strain Gv29-8 / FGSC 10586) TaxID=413071 RepID=G9N4S4_HYPVG|nr:uncharacterized protein TRIVIDRAFT_213946 [Trichoderma virens Gv29-8]EHK18598.1 hypothetical protein TRIVIDRAFT_213946 [Trichoderma virens Gv29-8]